MNSRLIIIEGLPCSGKSTTSAFVADTLKSKGNYNVEFSDEGSGKHPADYEFHSFIDFSALNEFSESEKTRIKSLSEEKKDGYIVPLSEFGGEIFDKLLKYKVYDFLPWETERPIMLEKWHNFVNSADKDTIYIFNCVFLQNPMCETMMRFGFSEEKSYEYISQIYETVKSLNPKVIYLKNSNITSSVKKASNERKGWLEEVIDYHISGEYGKSIGANGFEGYISCLEERQKRELSILSKLEIDCLILENPQNSWGIAYEKIKEFIRS